MRNIRRDGEDCTQPFRNHPTKVAYLHGNTFHSFATMPWWAGQAPCLSIIMYWVSWETRRKPRLLFVFDGVLLRFDTRQFLALLFQLPPRFTRLEPALYGSTPTICRAKALQSALQAKASMAVCLMRADSSDRYPSSISRYMVHILCRSLQRLFWLSLSL